MIQEALDELDRLAQDRPALAEPASMFRRYLRILGQPAPELHIPERSADVISSKIAAGVPLLGGERLQFDTFKLLERLLKVCSIFGADTVGRCIREEQLGVEHLVSAILAGKTESLTMQIESSELDRGQVVAMTRYSLFPSLCALRKRLRVSAAAWQQGVCPTCGGQPMLAETRGIEQMRHLRCGLCGDEWNVPRLFCPGCANRDHRTLGYLSVEGEEAKYRAATCEVCHGYLKVVSTLSPLSEARLLVADLATTHLDLIAADRGFLPTA